MLILKSIILTFFFGLPIQELCLTEGAYYILDCQSKVTGNAITMKTFIFLASILLIAVSASHSAPENEVLVLLDNLAVRETHSIFFKTLNGEKTKGDVSDFY